MTEPSDDIPSTRTALKRRERQELDDGDPLDTVWYVPRVNPGGWQKESGVRSDSSQGKCYHDDPNCRYLHRATRPATSTNREVIQKRSYAPCIECVLGFERDRSEATKQAMEDASCPLCGADDFDYLPRHLTQCPARD